MSFVYRSLTHLPPFAIYYVLPPLCPTGIWQFTVPDLQFNGVKCATPPACTGVLTQRDVFNLFYDRWVADIDSFTLNYRRDSVRLLLWLRTQILGEGEVKIGVRGSLSSHLTHHRRCELILSVVCRICEQLRQPLPRSQNTLCNHHYTRLASGTVQDGRYPTVSPVHKGSFRGGHHLCEWTNELVRACVCVNASVNMNNWVSKDVFFF